MQYGELYRLSNRNYRRMLRDGKTGELLTWTEYGAKKLSDDVENVTDWEQREFAAALDLETAKPTPAASRG